MIISKNSMLTESEIIGFLEKESVGIKFAYEGHATYNLEEARKNHKSVSIDNSKSKMKYYCFCKKGQKETIEKYCPHCGNGIYKKFFEISSEEYRKQVSDAEVQMNADVDDFNRKNRDERLYTNWFFGAYEGKKKLYDKFYVCKHPEYEHGIIIRKISIIAEAKKNDLVINGKIEREIEIVPGEFSRAYIYKSNNKKTTDLFTAFGLSSNTAKYKIEMDWENANNMFEFLNIHKDFTKRTAILEVFNEADNLIFKNNFFMMYMYLYSEYPVFELLAKMNYTRILTQSFTRVLESCNKERMRKNAKELEKIFNPHGTSGKLSLNLPKYIGDYLNSVHSTYNDFEYWSDIYEYDKLSKENFLSIVTGEDFTKFYEILPVISDALKYGYTVKKMITYVYKQSSILHSNEKEVMRLIIDYQRILELLGAEFDLYPSNIKKAHDKAFKSYQLVKNELTDRKLKKVKENALPSVIDDEEYKIIIPETTVEFVEEGNRQHNCVASYVRRVAGDECFIFFIRKKEDPDTNFVTAEYRRGRLYQIKEKNNYDVTNPRVKKFASEFCEKLSKNKNFSHI